MSIFDTAPRLTPSAATIGISFFGSNERVQNSPIASVTLVASVSRRSHGNFWIARRPLIWHGVPTRAIRSTPSGQRSFNIASASDW